MEVLKIKFYKDGVGKQKISDASLEARFTWVAKVKDWNTEQREALIENIDQMITYLQDEKDSILKLPNL